VNPGRAKFVAGFRIAHPGDEIPEAAAMLSPVGALWMSAMFP
jgi:hypothetical protein